MNLAERETHIPKSCYAKAVSETPTNPRILYIIGQLRQGGAEQQLYYLLKYLKPRALVVALSQGGYWVDPMRELGVEVIELPRKGSFDVVRLRGLTKIIRDYRPDIIHIFLDNVPGLYGRLAALLTGHFKVVTGERNEAAIQQPLWYRMLKRLMNIAVAAVVSNSKANYDYLLNHRIAAPQKLSCIPNGLELELFTRSGVENRCVSRRINDNDNEGLQVGTIGSLVPVKAPEVFIRAAALVLRKHQHVKFIHVGDGPLRSQMEELTCRLGIEDGFRFAGQQGDVRQQLARMDLFVLTSKTEGLPNAVMEAMSAGLPCVVTDAGGCREVVHDGETGFVVPIGDEEKLAERIEELLLNEQLRRRMGQKGQQDMSRFDCHNMAEKYRQLYRQVLAVQVN